jgi:hypothetical protein
VHSDYTSRTGIGSSECCLESTPKLLDRPERSETAAFGLVERSRYRANLAGGTGCGSRYDADLR